MAEARWILKCWSVLPSAIAAPHRTALLSSQDFSQIPVSFRPCDDNRRPLTAQKTFGFNGTFVFVFKFVVCYWLRLVNSWQVILRKADMRMVGSWPALNASHPSPPQPNPSPHCRGGQILNSHHKAFSAPFLVCCSSWLTVQKKCTFKEPSKKNIEQEERSLRRDPFKKCPAST